MLHILSLKLTFSDFCNLVLNALAILADFRRGRFPPQFLTWWEDFVGRFITQVSISFNSLSTGARKEANWGTKCREPSPEQSSTSSTGGRWRDAGRKYTSHLPGQSRHRVRPTRRVHSSLWRILQSTYSSFYFHFPTSSCSAPAEQPFFAGAYFLE